MPRRAKRPLLPAQEETPSQTGVPRDTEDPPKTEDLEAQDVGATPSVVRSSLYSLPEVRPMLGNVRNESSRRGRGRPPLPAEKKKTADLQIALTPGEKQSLQDLADELDLSLTSLVAQAIKEFKKKRERLNKRGAKPS